MTGCTKDYHRRPEYLRPADSPSEMDVKQSPLVLLAQTCSQIGRDNSSSSSSSINRDSAPSKIFSGAPHLLHLPVDKSSAKPDPKTRSTISYHPAAPTCPLPLDLKSSGAKRSGTPQSALSPVRKRQKTSPEQGAGKWADRDRRSEPIPQARPVTDGNQRSRSAENAGKLSARPIGGIPTPLAPQQMMSDPFCCHLPHLAPHHHVIEKQLGGMLSLQSCYLQMMMAANPRQFAQMPVSSATPVPVPQPAPATQHVCNWNVGGGGSCGKTFASADELLEHLKVHTAAPASAPSLNKLTTPAAPPYAAYLQQQQQLAATLMSRSTPSPSMFGRFSAAYAKPGVFGQLTVPPSAAVAGIGPYSAVAPFLYGGSGQRFDNFTYH